MIFPWNLNNLSRKIHCMCLNLFGSRPFRINDYFDESLKFAN